METIKREIIIIYNGFSRASGYGISTYISQLNRILENSPTIENYYHVILNGKGKEIEIRQEKKCREIRIPFRNSHTKSREYYHKSIPYILHEFIPPRKDVRLIFHLQSMEYGVLVESIRKLYAGKIILTVHYMQWCMQLSGNCEQIKPILRKKLSSLRDKEKEIRKEFYKDKKIIKKSDSVIFISENSWKRGIEWGQKIREKACLIPNTLEDRYVELTQQEKNKLKEKYYIHPDTQILLFAGRLEELKGVYHLIEAYKQVLTNYQQVHLFMIGDGDYNECISKTSEISSKISFTGYLPQEKLIEYYRIADIGIVPSLHEEFGYVALEMMMQRIPLIVHDTGGLSSLVEHGYSGMKYTLNPLSGPGTTPDSSGLTNLIMLYLRDPELARKIADNGRKVYLEKYQAIHMQKQILALYENQ